jgi:hypothetical protein
MSLRAAWTASALRHWPLFVVLLLAAGLRIAAGEAYRPVLFFYYDSWAYLDAAYSGATFSFATVSTALHQAQEQLAQLIWYSNVRPPGYPLVLKALAHFGRDLGLVTTVQHVAGLVTGVVVYSLLLRLGVRRLVATAAAAALLLDGYGIALEQHLMAETFFSLAVCSALTVTLLRPRSAWALVVSGLLLSGAALLRTSGVFVIVVWVAYLAWSSRDRRAVIAAAAAVLPLVLYASSFAQINGSFGLTQSDGWFLYGRVGEIVDCRTVAPPRAMRPLCVRASAARGHSPGYWLWADSSPGVRTFGGRSPRRDPRKAAAANRALRAFAVSMIEHHPAAYGRIVARDFLRFFEPSPDAQATAIDFPAPGERQPIDPWILKREIPSYRLSTGGLAPAAYEYALRVHTPRFLLGLLVLGSLVALWRGAPGNRRAIALLIASGLALLLGSAATSDFDVRYLVPAAPLLVAGSALAWSGFAQAARGRARTMGRSRRAKARARVGA